MRQTCQSPLWTPMYGISLGFFILCVSINCSIGSMLKQEHVYILWFRSNEFKCKVTFICITDI